LKKSAFCGFGFEKCMLACTQHVAGGPEMFYLVDKEVDPEFTRSLNEGDRAKVSKSAIVRLLGDGNKPSPFPEWG
jgi:hypothetical protein